MGALARLFDSLIKPLARFSSRNSLRAASLVWERGYIGLYSGSVPGYNLITRLVFLWGANFLALSEEKTSG